MFATLNGVEGVNGVPGVSGGDVRMIMMGKLLEDRIDLTLSTTEMGEALCRRYGLQARYPILRTRRSSGIRANVERIIKSCANIPNAEFDVAYSSGEHLYDVLPAALLKLRRRIPWIALVHWVEELPWKDKRGGTPALTRYLYWLNRVAAMLLIKYFADRVLAVSPSTREKLITLRGFSRERLGTVLCGLDLPYALGIRERSAEKHYDAAFMKRLNYGKGIRDLIAIWRAVVDVKPDAKLQIIGQGSPAIVDEVRGAVAAAGIERNVEITGVIHDPQEKARRLAETRLFVLPSHEENWAIVIGEALAAGLPVIAYDLREIRPLWGDRVTWVPLHDVEGFAREVVRRLDRPEQPPLDSFLRSLDWKVIAENEYREISGVQMRASRGRP